MASGKRRAIQGVLNFLYRVALRAVDKIFFQNSDDARFFRDHGLLPKHLPVVIVNGSGVDLEWYRPAPFPAGPTRFLLIARLLSSKGIREYCRAAAMIRMSNPEAEFHLVGGFDSNPDVLGPEEISRWNGEGAIVWHGKVSDVRPFIENCHVFVLPSYREGTPRSVLEAMAMGRAIVTTDAPGCRETVIEGQNGYLVPPRSVEPLARAMERFLDEPQLIERMGRLSRELARQKYDVRKVNAQMLREMELA
jgi:glycosyltransferase involved in cell wall biosynthesis